jgi:AcrR family transcriptional regulator
MALVACRGVSPSAQSVNQKQLEMLVDSLMPGVAKAAGLEFKSTPRSAVRTKEQIRAYLIAKLARELPDDRLEGITATYRLLNMIPDTLDLRALFLALYTEQVAGFYDPDSTTLFAVQGGDPAQLRLVLAHELVHALQHQYLPLDSILHDVTDGDRQTAAQAVMEGQATLVSMVAILPGVDIQTDDAFWDNFRDQLSKQQFGATVFAGAPMVIREGLTFPYIDGAQFMRTYDRTHPGKVPFGTALPMSTEQILHPDRYASGDKPITVRFIGDTAGVIFEDTFGEFDIELLRAQLIGATSVRTDPAIGWGGDRLRVYRSAAGPALVWVTVWDEPRYAAQFTAQVAGPLSQHPGAGNRTTVEPIQVAGRAGVRVVVAPTGWSGWKSLPQVEIRP